MSGRSILRGWAHACLGGRVGLFGSMVQGKPRSKCVLKGGAG